MDVDALACVITPILQAFHGELNTVRVERAKRWESLAVSDRFSPPLCCLSTRCLLSPMPGSYPAVGERVGEIRLAYLRLYRNEVGIGLFPFLVASKGVKNKTIPAIVRFRLQAENVGELMRQIAGRDIKQSMPSSGIQRKPGGSD